LGSKIFPVPGKGFQMEGGGGPPTQLIGKDEVTQKFLGELIPPNIRPPLGEFPPQ